MALGLAFINQQIEDETKSCIESTKKSKFLGGLFYPRKKAEPTCRIQSQTKYANELTAAKDAAIWQEETELGALNAQLAGGLDKKSMMIIGGVFVFLIILVILID